MFLFFAILSVTAFGQIGSPEKPQPVQSALVSLKFEPPVGELWEVSYVQTDIEGGTKFRLTGGSTIIDAFGLEGQTQSRTEVRSNWRVLDRDAKGNTTIEINHIFVGVARTLGRAVYSALPAYAVEQGKVVGWRTYEPVAETNGHILKELMFHLDDPNAAKVYKLFDEMEATRKAVAAYFIDRPFRLVVNRQGQVVDVIDLDLLMDEYRTQAGKITPDIAVRARQDALVSAFFSGASVRSSFEAFLMNSFPADPTAVGSKWSRKFEFDVAGLARIPVDRSFTLEKKADYSDDRFVVISKMSSTLLPKADTTLRLDWNANTSAEIDPSTGLYYDQTISGRYELRAKNSPSGSPPITYDNFSAKIGFSSVAKRDVKRPDMWKFYGGYEEFTILLGDRWRRQPLNTQYLNMTDFAKIGSSTTIATKIESTSTAAKDAKSGVDGMLAKLCGGSYVRNSAKAELPTAKMGTFELARARCDVTFESDLQRHFVVQILKSDTKVFTFVISLPEAATEVDRREANEILDSIEVRN